MNDADLFVLHQVVWGACKWDMTNFDAWLADPAEWQGREHARQQLHDGREALRHAFKQGASDEQIERDAELLLLRAKVEGMGRAGRGLERKVVAHGVVQANRRAGKTKLSDTEKRQVIREYDAALVQYGTVQALAHKFNVSEDTIQRVLKKRHSIAAKPG